MSLAAVLASAAGSLIAAAVIAGALIPTKGRVSAWWKRLRQPEQGSWTVIAGGYCSVDSGSRFIFGLHVNLDERVDPFEVAVDAAKRGGFDVAEPCRKYAHFWLPGDELKAGRALGRPGAGAAGRWGGGSASTTGLSSSRRSGRSTPTRHRARTSKMSNSRCTMTPSTSSRPRGRGCRCTSRTWRMRTECWSTGC